jgi:hypothetical protein
VEEGKKSRRRRFHPTDPFAPIGDEGEGRRMRAEGRIGKDEEETLPTKGSVTAK